MIRLTAVIYVLVFTVLAGAAVTAMLSLDRVSAIEITLAALAGAVVALPVAWLVARRVQAEIGRGRA